MGSPFCDAACLSQVIRCDKKIATENSSVSFFEHSTKQDRHIESPIKTKSEELASLGILTL